MRHPAAADKFVDHVAADNSMIMPSLFPLRFALALLIGQVCSPLAMAQSLPRGTEFQVFIENDMLSRTDRYYTNGIKFGGGLPYDVLHDLLGDMLEGPAAGVLDRLAPREGGEIKVGMFAGQNLYTPKSIKVSAPQPNDRPWAAWLYVGGVAQRAKGNRLDSVELDVGMVGPAALGREVQSNWHHLIGSPQPQGWQNQIPNEPGFLVSYLAKQRIARGNWELIPHAGATVGTVMTLARVGGLLRWGRNMSGFGPDTIEPGGAMLHAMRREVTTGASGLEWYAFVGVDHRLVAHNIFLDGTVFRDSPSVGRRAHVHDLSYGLSARVNSLRVSLTRVRRSEEFFTAAGGGGRQQFDSLNVGMEF